MDMIVYGDMVYWAKFGVHCQKLVTVNLTLAQYRWHQTNQAVYVAPDLKYLVVDCWRTMRMVEGLRQRPPGLIRRVKLKGLMAVRSGIMSKRFRQMGNTDYSRKIVVQAREYTGLPLWMAGQFLVELRDLVVFKLAGRPQDPQNIFS